jgi:hypothetical protein
VPQSDIGGCRQSKARFSKRREFSGAAAANVGTLKPAARVPTPPRLDKSPAASPEAVLGLGGLACGLGTRIRKSSDLLVDCANVANCDADGSYLVARLQTLFK